MTDATPENVMPEATHQYPTAASRLGDQGEQVRLAQAYLRRFGYLPNDDLAASYTAWRSAVAFGPAVEDEFDENLEMAVRIFQGTYGLEVTGEVDDATLELMGRPRCGFPDIVQTGDAPSFVAQGNRWPGPNVTFRHVNFTPDLSAADVRSAIRGSFDRWATHVPLSFTESATADIEIGFFAGNHGDGATNAFDGPSGVLAHCYYPPPNGGAIAGDCHFDEAETWSVNTPPSGIDLPTVSLHELGHGLGLNHSNDTNAVMYAFYGGPRRELTGDDIAGIQSIYGARFRWGSLGGVISMPVVARNADGRLEVFVQGSDGALWHIWQTAPNNGWSGWASLGGWITQPVVGQNADGRLEVFARGSDGALWHIWQTAPNNGWSGWASLGGVISMPTVGRNADGRLEVFAQGTDGALWHIWQTAPNNGWSGWASLGGWITNPTVARNADGRLEVFVQGSDNALWHMWQTAPNNGWSGWASPRRLDPQPGGGPERRRPDGGVRAGLGQRVVAHVADRAEQRLERLGDASAAGSATRSSTTTRTAGWRCSSRGSDGALWHIWQTAPNNGWSGWGGCPGR